MNYIVNYGKTILCAAGICLLTTGCSILGGGDVAAEYEAANYNTDVYQSKLFAEELCVAPEDVKLDGAPDGDTYTEAALFDLDNKKVDFSKDMYEQLYPASTTKIMTALVALENADLSSLVTVSAEADSGNFAADEQVCGIKAGDQLTLEDLLYGLLLYSGNDNAVAIADYIAGDMESFADMMNEEAASLMATDTHFVNSNGLHDEDHYTTAYDLYLIFNQCIQHEAFTDMIETSAYTANITGADKSKRQITWKPTNYYATGETQKPESGIVLGGKTGTTKPAGNCLILLVQDEEANPYISVVMGADTKELLYENMTSLIEAIPADSN